MAQAHSTTRSNRRRRHGGLQFWAALVLALVAGTAAWLVFSCDIDWPARNRAARRLGLAAEDAGDFPRARAHYEAALADNPYDWNTRLSLANLLNHRLGVRDEALRQYLLALAYSPDHEIIPATEEEIRILRLIRSGELEDPSLAVDDIFAAAGTGAKWLFLRRLDPTLRAGGESYWEGWKRRGRGEIRYSHVASGHNGLYDAVLELAFPDGAVMAVRLRCPLRNTWRLSLSFP
jgi:tetratricopeptide (TPR) repeat protein